MWVGSGYQKEADTIGFWYKLLIAELPFEKIRTRQISSEAESSSTPVSQCPPSVSEQVSWCPPVPGSVTIPNSSCHDPTFPLNELQPTAAAGRPTLHFLCIPDYPLCSVFYGKLHYKNHLIYLGSSINQSQGKPCHYIWLLFELHQLFRMSVGQPMN